MKQRKNDVQWEGSALDQALTEKDTDRESRLLRETHLGKTVSTAMALNRLNRSRFDPAERAAAMAEIVQLQTPEPKRTSITFTPQGQLDARDLADLQQTSITEAIHRSLRLNMELVDWERAGGEIVVRAGDQEWPISFLPGLRSKCQE